MLGRTMRAVRLSEMRVSVGLFGGVPSPTSKLGALEVPRKYPWPLGPC